MSGVRDVFARATPQMPPNGGEPCRATSPGAATGCNDRRMPTLQCGASAECRKLQTTMSRQDPALAPLLLSADGRPLKYVTRLAYNARTSKSARSAYPRSVVRSKLKSDGQRPPVVQECA